MNFKKLASISNKLDLKFPEKSKKERVAEKYSKEEIQTIIDKVTNAKDVDEMYSYTDEILEGTTIKSLRPEAIKQGLLSILMSLLSYK